MNLRLSEYCVRVSAVGYEWWFSTTTEAILRLDPATAAALRGDLGEITIDSLCDNLELLKTSGFVVPAHFDEVTAVQQSFDNAKTAVDTLPVTIAPTLGCNFSCAYCFERNTTDFKSGRRWTDEIRSNVLSYILSNLAGRKGLSVRWFGGEPLLALDDVLFIGRQLTELAAISQIKFHSRIQTNGHRLTEAICRLLRDAGVSEVHVTLDGHRDRHNRIRVDQDDNDSFGTILRNLRSALDIFPTVQVRVNTVPAVAASFDRMLDSLAEIDPERRLSIYLAPIYRHFNGSINVGNAAAGFGSVAAFADTELDFVSLLLKRGYGFDWGFLRTKALPCSAVKADGLMIGPRGEIVKCDHEYGVLDAALGTVSSGITRLDRLAEWLAVNPRNNPLCSTCVLLPTCGGHCESLRRTLPVPEEACPSKKYNFEQRAILGIQHSSWSSLPYAAVALVRPPRQLRSPVVCDM